MKRQLYSAAQPIDEDDLQQMIARKDRIIMQCKNQWRKALTKIEELQSENMILSVDLGITAGNLQKARAEIFALKSELQMQSTMDNVRNGKSPSKAETNEEELKELKDKLKEQKRIIITLRTKLRDFAENAYSEDEEEKEVTPSEPESAEDIRADTEELMNLDVSDPSDSEYRLSEDEACEDNDDSNVEDEQEADEAMEERNIEDKEKADDDVNIEIV